MAAAPAATSFSNSEEAFKYPLPTIRQFHKQLQVALDEKNARLRTLVGGSYRQLLGTAETIVDMRHDIESAESKLARVADGCGRMAIGKKVTGLGKLGVTDDSGHAREIDLGWLARVKVLDGCAIAIGRLLRGRNAPEQGPSRGSRLVTAAKVWVLSRLLAKSLGDESTTAQSLPDGSDNLLEELRRKLEHLRRRLRRSVERMLEKIDGDRENLVQALCAHSLASSSGARDVMRHFLYVRGKTMALAFEDEEHAAGKGGKEESMLRALALFTRTLLDAQAMVPRLLSDALLDLKRRPLLKDDAVHELEGLRLDLCERWLGDDILFFSPYIRHDELDGPQAVEMLRAWAGKASEVLLRGFEKSLERIMDFKMVVEIRTKIFESWISEGGKARGFDSSIMLNGLRTVVNDRLVSLIEARVQKLHLVGTEIEAVLESWGSLPLERHGSIWNHDLLEMELNGGAAEFKQVVVSGVNGRNNIVSRVVKGYETWRHLIDELFLINDQLKNQRWDNDLESFEDEEILESRSEILNKDDPEMLQHHMDTGLENAYKNLHQKIATQLASHDNSEISGGIAIFMLRVVRGIRAALPKRPDLQSFGLSMIPTLHRTLAISVLRDPMGSLVESFSKHRRVIGRALWEGSPELPVQSSPSIFRFLHSLTSSMADTGSDLWSPTAVNVLKDHLRGRLGQEWSTALKSYDLQETTQPNGHKGNDPGEPNGTGSANSQTNGDSLTLPADETRNHEVLIQSLFDILVLQQSLHTPGSDEPDDSLINLSEFLIHRVDLTTSSRQRLQRAAQEYWKRTNLLFGLLV